MSAQDARWRPTHCCSPSTNWFRPLSIQSTDTAAKRLELLREVVPGLRRLAIMANIGAPGAVLEMREAQAAASALGLEAVVLEIRRAEDVSPAFEMLKGRAEALDVVPDPLLNTNRGSYQHLSAGRASADDARSAGVPRSGWPDVVWTKHRRRVSTRRRLCRQNSARGQAWRHSGRAAD